jgi:adenylosuccinate synthase
MSLGKYHRLRWASRERGQGSHRGLLGPQARMGRRDLLVHDERRAHVGRATTATRRSWSSKSRWLVVSKRIPHLMIGPGSAITLTQLFKEIEEFDAMGFNVSKRLMIHPNAMIIEQQDVDYEFKETRYLGSTAKGCGRALARKAMRSKDVRLAKDVGVLREFIFDTTTLVNDIIDSGGHVLIEGSQGFDLDLNHGIQYPYCTSRGTTPQQTLADCGISGSCVDTTIATLRSYPIRVGNIVENGEQVGYSGPFGGRELTWAEIRARSGADVDLEERTTVTQRVRRIFEIDMERLRFMVQVTRPTSIALTFADYIDWKMRNAKNDQGSIEMSQKLANFVGELEDSTGVSVDYIKTGAADSSILDMETISSYDVVSG